MTFSSCTPSSWFRKKKKKEGGSLCCIDLFKYVANRPRCSCGDGGGETKGTVTLLKLTTGRAPREQLAPSSAVGTAGKRGLRWRLSQFPEVALRLGMSAENMVVLMLTFPRWEWRERNREWVRERECSIDWKSGLYALARCDCKLLLSTLHCVALIFAAHTDTHSTSVEPSGGVISSQLQIQALFEFDAAQMCVCFGLGYPRT